MRRIAVALCWVARLDGIGALIIGIVLWTGSPRLLAVHILAGFIMSLTLLLMGILAFFARLKPAIPIVAIVWALLLPYVGFAQVKFLGGPSQVIVQVIHFVLGICAIGIVEMLASKMKRRSSA